MKCEHKWVDMEDGTNDRFCVRCRKFAMQAVATLPTKLRSELTVGPSSIGEAINSITHVELNAQLDDIRNLLKDEMKKDMMKATRLRGVL